MDYGVRGRGGGGGGRRRLSCRWRTLTFGKLLPLTGEQKQKFIFYFIFSKNINYILLFF